MAEGKLTSTILLAVALCGCEMLPTSGPYAGDIKNGAATTVEETEPYQVRRSSLPYALIEVSEPVVRVLNYEDPLAEETVPWPSDVYPEFIKVNIGDTLSITIYESQSGGLFIPTEAGVRPGNFITLPPQTIDQSGVVTVPYVGLVEVAGRTPISISQNIMKRLSKRAIEPQVVVSISQKNGAEVSVIGEVQDATRFPLSYEGDKVLDAIARAGGPSVPGYEAFVTLQRKGKEYTIPFDALVQSPEKNIYLKAGDTVYIYSEPKNYMVYGASQLKGNYSFGKRKLYLSEALANANGLNDNRADPAEIYIYRHENPKNIRYLENLPSNISAQKMSSKEMPIIYKLNLRDPSGFFLAQKFPIEASDIIYVANAEAAEFTKFLNILNNTATTYSNAENSFIN